MSARRLLAVVPVLLALAVTGCAKSGAGSASGAPGPSVTATDSACEVSQRTVPAGTHTFAVSNKGSQVTEVYVYGAGDSVIGEVENVGPGTTRDLKVKLSAGDYSVACKPGMKGDGIRTPITVTG